MDYWIVWLLIVFFLSFIEVVTVNLVTIWFIVSALVSLLLSFFVDSFTIQFIVFGILGIILLLTTGKSLKKIFDEEQTRTNADRVIGMIGVVTEEIKKNVVGEVKVDGKRWSAISTKTIKVGEEVLIEKIDGVKLVVKKEIVEASQKKTKPKTTSKSTKKNSATTKNKKEKED